MLGVQLLHSCERPVVDIVFVHGLRGDSVRTWATAVKATESAKERTSLSKRLRGLKLGKSSSKVEQLLLNPTSEQSSKPSASTSSILWPRDLLATDVQDARILTYGYDAAISTFLTKTADNSIFNIAQDLITRLEMFRQSEETEQLPIIFIAHSLGGLVVKDALKFSQDQAGFQQYLHSIFACTYGVIFFGTPHRGSEMASLGKTAARIAGLGLSESDQHLLQSLEQGSPELKRIADSFSRMLPKQAKGLQVYSFQEGLPLTGLNILGKVVEDYSSTIGDAYEGKAIINANHMEMCKFSNKDDSDYILVSGVIKRWTRDAQKGKQKTEMNNSAGPKLEPQRDAVQTAVRDEPISLEADVLPAFRLPQVPARHFLGRDTELKTIRNSFITQKASGVLQRIVVVHGLGGVGKTQLALAYAYGNKKTYKATFWINARSERTILLGFQEIAQNLVDWAAELCKSAINFTRIGYELGLGQSVSPTTGEVVPPSPNGLAVVDAVKAWLEKEKNSGWLLIFDSADDLEEVDLQRFFPTASTGDILLTSRRFQASQLGVGVNLSGLRSKDAQELLAKAGQLQNLEVLPSEANTNIRLEQARYCKLIADTLGYLPLALAQAGSYMAATGTSAEGYLEYFNRERKSVLKDRPPKALWQYEESTFTTWELSFASIQSKSPVTAKFLLLCGYFHPENIPYILFDFGVRVDGLRAATWDTLGSMPAHTAKKSILSLKKMLQPHSAIKSVLSSLTWLRDLISNKAAFRSSIHLLLDYSLITENVPKDGFTMHSLVRYWCYLKEVPQRMELAVDAACLIGRALDIDLNDAKARSTITGFQSHVFQFLSVFSEIEFVIPSSRTTDLSLPLALEAVAEFLREIRVYEEAIQILEFNCAFLSAALGEDHSLTMAVVNDLAIALEDLGRFADSEALLRGLVKRAEKALGRKDPDFWTYMGNLGSNLSSQDTDKFEEAGQILETVVAEKMRLFGIECVLSTLANLGIVYQALGQQEKALQTLRTVIDGFRKSPGSDTADSLQAIRWAGHIASNLGKREECEQAILKAIEIAEKKYGRQDPLTLFWYNNLADFLTTEDLPGMNDSRLERILSIYAVLTSSWPIILGQNDHETPRIQVILAGFFYKLGNFERSYSILQDSLQRLSLFKARQNLLADLPVEAGALNMLGMLYWDRGLLSDAIDCYDRVISLYESVQKTSEQRMGVLQTVKANRALALRDAGQLTDGERALKALLLEHKTLDANTKLLWQNNLATIYQMQGRATEALELFTQTLGGIDKADKSEPGVYRLDAGYVQGILNTSKLLVAHNLAVLHEELGNIDEAIRILKGTFNGKEAQLGLWSPATLKTALALARLYRIRQNKVDAEEVADKIRPYLDHA